MTQTQTNPRSLWAFLTEPHPMLRQRRDRQRATLLAATSLALAILGLPPGLYGLLALNEPRAAVGLIQSGLMLICYALSRTRYAHAGAVTLAFGQIALSFGSLFLIQDESTSTSTIAFMLAPILFSMVLLPARWTVMLALAVNLGLGGYVFSTNNQGLIIPLLFIVVTSIIAAVAAVVRERDLDTIEEQSRLLAQRSHVAESESDEHTRAIMITADIARMMTGARDVDAMLAQVAKLIVERFHFYHVQIFLLDVGARQAKLHAAAGGPASEKLMAQNHALPLAVQSVVTRVISRGEALAVNDTDTDPIHRRNELLPNTRSEIGLPLRASGQVIGALNIQSSSPNAFTLADIAVFQTIADQMAISIENARLFERAQRDLADIETLNRQLTGEAWGSYLKGRKGDSPIGYASAGGQVAPITQTDEAEPAPAEGTISLPLKIRGETIGLLDVTARSGETPDSDTRSMLEAVAERVALALDSTRLGEQAQRQAEREQILSKISAELQATTDMNAILKIAARESSKALGASRSFVHLTMEYSKDKPG